MNDDDWQAEQHRDLMLQQAELVRLLAISTTRALTEDEAMTLAAQEGVVNELYKEIRAS